jgi:purine-nucleoside phosphorylase
LARSVERKTVLPYDQIPNFPLSTVESHQGNLMLGELGGRPVMVMQGRFHYYEGYTAGEVGYPIRAMKMLGIETLFISNAAGGMNSSFKVGDLMIIKDHISFFVANPLIGLNEKELGPRFPDMSEPYSKK